MLNYIKNLFSSDKKKLREAVLTTQTMTVAVKTAAYHEIVSARDYLMMNTQG